MTPQQWAESIGGGMVAFIGVVLLVLAAWRRLAVSIAELRQSFSAIAEDALAQRALVVDWATAATVEDLADMVQDQVITMLDRQVVIMQALADLYRHRATTSASTVLTHEASEYLARNQFQAESLTRGLSPRRGCMTRRHLPVPTPPDAE